jgi:hypothetical protein
VTRVVCSECQRLADRLHAQLALLEVAEQDHDRRLADDLRKKADRQIEAVKAHLQEVHQLRLPF